MKINAVHVVNLKHFLGDFRSRRYAGSACVLHVDKVIISEKRKKTLGREHRCNTVGADPRRGNRDMILLFQLLNL